MPEMDIVEALNELIATSKDGQKRYLEAERLVHDVSLKQIFHRFAEDWVVATRDLEACIVGAGSYPDNTGSTAGAIHRDLMNVRARFMPNEERTVLQECEAAEDRTREVFVAVMKTDLPPAIKPVVEKHYAVAVDHRQFVRSLRDQYGRTG